MGEGDPFDPATLCVDAFLAGPDRLADWDGEGDLLDVDDVFAKPFDRVLAEQAEDHATYGGPSVTPDAEAVRTPALKAPGYSFVDVEAGLLLVAPDGTPCGGYVGCDVSVDEAHRGLGLGAELILEYAMRNGSLPTWDLDEAAYSEAGVAAHRSAHGLARDRAFFAAKRDALVEARDAACPRAPSP